MLDDETLSLTELTIFNQNQTHNISVEVKREYKKKET